MGLLANFIQGVRSLFRRDAIESEMDEELKGFVEGSAADKQRSGMPAEQAICAARAEMGGTNAVKHRIRASAWETSHPMRRSRPISSASSRTAAS